MAYKTVVRVDTRCPHHIRFHPERDGLGGVKGGCGYCVALCEIYQAVQRIRRIASDDALSKRTQ